MLRVLVVPSEPQPGRSEPPASTVTAGRAGVSEEVAKLAPLPTVTSCWPASRCR